eukprot:CAMPEP_0172699562 /NCGR_PEP_ID=MMETSP1074-20121228/30274_1 /TAXON_ID=2916 /ORGANISM="Ceratium fusus, Strain PA161109" /LENGTH=47 /DNA_ID= /DNA_START= /DNA_END= /DNA_ORIENTATION=
MGAMLGAAFGSSRIPGHLKEGLKNFETIEQNVAAFMASLQEATPAAN